MAFPRGTAALLGAVERLLGRRPAGFRPTPGGWTVSVRGIVELEGGRRVFAKLGDVPDTIAAVRQEIEIYRVLGEAPCRPRLIAADPAVPVLVIESLEEATWPPPWTPALLEAFGDLCDELASTRAPEALPPLSADVVGDGWERVAADPAAAARVLDARWIDQHLDTLVAAQHAAPVAGDSLVHTDLRSDNLAFRGGRGIAVDWNLARRGPAGWDRVLVAPATHLEGAGPLERLAPAADPGIVAWMAGFFASRAGLPPPEGAPRVRAFQRQQLEVALPWACRLLELDAPPGTG